MAEKKGYVRRSVRSMFNVSKWFAWGEVVASSKIFFSIAKGVLKRPSEKALEETFEEAVQRLHLTEEDIKYRQKALFRNAAIFLGMSAILLIYTIYLLTKAHILAFFMGLLLTALVLTFAYREHFWYTQVKYRKLGLDFKTWRRLFLKKGETL